MPEYPFTIWYRRALRRYLARRGISRNELARKLGTTGATLHRYDRGLSFPDVDMQLKLAATFGATEDEVARVVRDSEKRRQREAQRLERTASDRERGVRRRAKAQSGSWLGCMAGTGQILGDIISPAFDASEWEVLRPARR